MADNLEKITILLQARDKDLARSMDRMNRRIERFTRDSERNTARMQQQVEDHFARMGRSVIGFGRNLVTGLAVGAATTALGMLTTGLRDTVRSIAQVGDEARRAGVGVEAFQQWGYVAAQNRIPIDALTDGFKELNLRADEWIVTGAGPAAEAFARLGFSAEDLRRRLEDPSELMLEIFRRTQQLDRAAQIRVFDEVLGGTGGERSVELLAQGEQGLRRTMERAREVGAVMESDMIQRATILDQKFQELTTRVERFFQAAAVGLFAGGVETPADTLERLFGTLDRARDALGQPMFDALIAETGELTQTAEGAASAIAEMVDPEQLTQSARWLRGEIAGLASALHEAGNTEQAAAMRAIYVAVNQATQAFEDGTIGAQELTGALDSNVTAASEVVRGLGEVNAARFGGVLGALSGLIERLNATRDAAIQARSSMPGAGTMPMDTGAPLDPNGPILPGDVNMPSSPRPRPAPREGSSAYGGTGNRSGGGGSDGYRGAVEDIQARTRALELEAAALIAAAGSNQEYGAAIEYARIRAQLMNDATAEGRALTPELQAEIDRLAQAYVTAGQNAEEAADRMRQVQEDAERGADAIGSIFDAILQGGDAARQAIARLLQQMASSAFQRLLMGMTGSGGGKGGGLLSSLGGLLGFSAGGYTGAGGTHEPKGVVHGGEYVFSKQAVQALGVGRLEQLHQIAKGYAGGGFVGLMPPQCEGAGEIFIPGDAA